LSSQNRRSTPNAG